MGTKKGRIYGKVAPLKGVPQRFEGQLPQTAPPWFRHWPAYCTESSDEMLLPKWKSYRFKKM